MRKRSVLLVSALAATFSLHAWAQAPVADPKKPAAEPKPAPGPAAPAAPAPAAAPPAAAPPAATPEAPPAVEPPPTAEGTEEPTVGQEPAGSLPQAQPGLAPLPIWPEPSEDAAALKRQGAERPKAQPAAGDAVFAEDWWTHTRPILEWHGSLRARGELFYKFHLGRRDPLASALFPRPADHYYNQFANGQDRGPVGSQLCGSGSSNCDDNTNAGANMRFRLDPEFHVSDNLRVISQIDLLDNLVLGSTPGGYAVNDGQVSQRSGYAPLGIFDDTTAAPSAGRNSLRDSILVKRVWAEWVTPVGQLRFGRMPNHWGLGMVYNAGDGHDDDYQSTIDRAQITSGIKSLDLYASVAMDFVNEGATSDNFGTTRGQPYDAAQLDDVNQYTFTLVRRKSADMVAAALNRGDVVINGGVQVQYKHQLLAADSAGPCGSGAGSQNGAAFGCTPGKDTLPFVRRDAHMWMPDLWLQLRYRGFRFETEVATIQGKINNGSATTTADTGYKTRSWGFATELEQLLAENKLRLGFKAGWASGDSDVDSLTPGSGDQGVQNQYGDRTISTFRFHPSYALDLILYRNILTRVQGTYYFRPSVKYDFLRDPNGQKIGGGLAAIWSRASEFMQTPGHARDLGIELNGQIYFQSKDGSLNDDPNRMGGFFAKLEYAVLFPMSGLGYASVEASRLTNADTNLAQALRLYLGVSF
ncbi:MAG: TIGR04551 family protein [Myxococcales bacterium]|nr:MAG: TIGR04551 family protein [Myxococcales bacterium]